MRPRCTAAESEPTPPCARAHAGAREKSLKNFALRHSLAHAVTQELYRNAGSLELLCHVETSTPGRLAARKSVVELPRR